MIFKRKSFHLFSNTGDEKISSLELDDIQNTFKRLEPLIAHIRVAIKIVPASFTTCKRGEEYCILLYSEKGDNYLQNIGYLGEQLDLYLASRNIGVLWFGIGKVSEVKYNDLDFVIMLAIKKVSCDKFRKDMYKSKRKEVADIWLGNEYLDIANIVRFAPSACNTQPWIVESTKDELQVYRYKKAGKRGIMPTAAVTYYNCIDIGIFLLFLDICLKHHHIKYERLLLNDNGDRDSEKTKFAQYWLKMEKE